MANRKEAPGTLAQAAVSHGLGMPRYVFRTGIDAIAWWGVFMLLLVGAFCVMMTMIIKGESGLAYASPFIALGALCFLGALAIPLARVLAPVEWCQVYEYGFVYQRGARPPIAGCWDEITLFNRFDIKIVRNGMTMGYNSSVTIDVPAGRVELTKHFPAAKQLIDLLQDDYYKTRVHLALLAVQDGETKAFGAWQVSMDGLAHANGLIPWTEIKKIDVLGPTVEVYLRGELKPAMKVPLDDLHEPTVLLTVLDRLSRAARAERRCRPAEVARSPERLARCFDGPEMLEPGWCPGPVAARPRRSGRRLRRGHPEEVNRPGGAARRRHRADFTGRIPFIPTPV